MIRGFFFDRKYDMVTIYSFNDKVPVEIYDGKPVIDFKEIKEYVESWQ